MPSTGNNKEKQRLKYVTQIKKEEERRKNKALSKQKKLQLTQSRQQKDGDDGPAPDDNYLTGMVIEVSTSLCRVRVGTEVILCSLRGTLLTQEEYTSPIAVGDRVWVVHQQDGRGTIEEILPRQSLLARPDLAGTPRPQPLAANLDQLLIVASWRQPHFWPELIDRYIIAAERSGITPLICVNKIDLAEALSEVHAAIRPYRDLGYTLLLTSVAAQSGLDALRAELHGKITALSGLSGVGKSSLLSAVQPGFDLRTGAVNEERGQGRHTTTQAVMLPVGEDGYMVDTPGIREFGLVGMRPEEVMGYYPEIIRYGADCRFSDCKHIDEPDCSVKAAAEAGDLPLVRYESYLKIRESLTQ